MIKIVAFGNSLTAGFGLPIGCSFVDKLQEALNQLGKDVKVLNYGVNGDTTQGGIYRIDEALKEEPDIVILELGANDCLLGEPVENIEKNLSNLIEKCLDKGCKVILIGIAGFYEDSNPYEQKIREMYKRLAERYNLKLLPNFLEGILHNPNLTLFDNIHPNQDGVNIMVKNTLPLVLETLKEIT